MVALRVLRGANPDQEQFPTWKSRHRNSTAEWRPGEEILEPVARGEVGVTRTTGPVTSSLWGKPDYQIGCVFWCISGTFPGELVGPLVCHTFRFLHWVTLTYASSTSWICELILHIVERGEGGREGGRIKDKELLLGANKLVCLAEFENSRPGTSRGWPACSTISLCHHQEHLAGKVDNTTKIWWWWWLNPCKN